MRLGPSLKRKGPGRVSLPQTFDFVKVGLCSCNPLVFANRLLHSLYIQAAGYISERGNSCRRRARKVILRRAGFVPPSLSLRSIAAKLGHREEETGAALPDRTLDHESPRTPSVHLHHCLRVVIHHANPSAELRFESGSLQNSRQKLMVNPIEGLGLI